MPVFKGPWTSILWNFLRLTLKRSILSFSRFFVIHLLWCFERAIMYACLYFLCKRTWVLMWILIILEIVFIGKNMKNIYFHKHPDSETFAVFYSKQIIKMSASYLKETERLCDALSSPREVCDTYSRFSNLNTPGTLHTPNYFGSDSGFDSATASDSLHIFN